MKTELIKYYEDKKRNMLYFYAAIWFLLTLFMFFKLDTIVLDLITRAKQLQPDWILLEKDRIMLKIIAYLIDLFLPTSLIWTLYLFRLRYHNKEGWKKHFPQYDISGKWKDTTTYTNMVVDDGWVATDKIARKLKNKGWYNGAGNPAIPSMVIISQTCQEIQIEVSHGDGFVWKSLSANWYEDSLVILYEVIYNEELRKRGYPQLRHGFEKMQIDGNNLSLKDKPQKMTGYFWHCIANDGKPILMGDVIYERM